MESPLDAASQPAKKRTRSNVTKACLNCRRRKAKCDGQQPSCRTCVSYNDVCAWAGDGEDGRKPASRQYVVTLENRIKALEALLRKSGHAALPDEEDTGSRSESDEDIPAARSVDQATQSMLHLYMGNAGEEVHFHGPTSAFAHSSTARRATVSAIDSVPDFPLDAPHDYRRHLPSTVALSATEHNRVLDRFFRFYASWGMRATAKSFHADLIRSVTLPPNTPPVRFSYYSPFLHNIILAIGLRFADSANLRTHATRSLFADEANKYMRIEMSRPVLATVQALGLMSSWYSLSGQHSTGWVYFGLAERLSQSMGLHLDCAHLVEQGRMSDTEMILRRDTFWNIFCQEQCWSVYIGRCHSVQEYNTPLPQIDETMDQLPWRWDDIETSTANNLPPQPSMYSSTFLESAKLSRIMQRVMATLYSLSADMKKIERQNAITKLGLAIDAWSEQLPPSLVISSHSEKNALPHIIMLQLAKEWTIILTYRPHYRPIIGAHHESPENSTTDKRDVHTVAVQRCDRSASRINTLLRIYEDRIGLRFSPPTLTHIAFTAGTTHLLAAVHTRSVKAKAEALQRAKHCTQYIRLVAVSWDSADSKASILDSLINDYAPPSNDQRDTPEETSSHLQPDANDSTGGLPRQMASTSSLPILDHPQHAELPTAPSSDLSTLSSSSDPAQSSHDALQAMLERFQRNGTFNSGIHQVPSGNQQAIAPQSALPASFSPSELFRGAPTSMTVDDPYYFTQSVTGLRDNMFQGAISAGNSLPQHTSTIDPFLQSLFAHISYPPLQQSERSEYMSARAPQSVPLPDSLGQTGSISPTFWDSATINGLFGLSPSTGSFPH